MRRVAIVAGGAPLALSAASLAQISGFSRIDAKYALVGADAIDPSAHQPHDRVALFLSGDGAKKIYDAMPVAATDASNCEEGLRIKRSGGLTCTAEQGQYACDVGILLKSGQTRRVSVC